MELLALSVTFLVVSQLATSYHPKVLQIMLEALFKRKIYGMLQQFHFLRVQTFMDLLVLAHPTFFEQYTNYHGGSSSASTHQSNAFTQPSGDPVRYLREHGLWDTGRDVYFLRNNIDSQSLSLGGIIMEPGHRDDPIVIEDDEEDEHGDAQLDDIFYDGEMSYEALLELQEHIGGVEIGLKKSDISKLLKQSKILMMTGQN
ncbi:hypothetical protein KY284_020021 [Solanum tuberosum]|nr:hypothetical protein KY284_020021 [Solanum tuberosum]